MLEMRGMFRKCLISLIVVFICCQLNYVQLQEGKRCSDKHLLLLVENDTDKRSARILGVMTLVASALGIGNLLGSLATSGQKDEVTVVSPPPLPPQEASTTNITNTHLKYHTTFINNTNLTITSYSTNETNFYINRTYNNIDNTKTYTTTNHFNLTIGALNFKKGDKSLGGLGIFRLKPSIYTVIPDLQSAKLPVPKNRARLSLWPSDWPTARSRGSKLNCKKGLTTIGLQDVEGRDNQVELKCFVDEKGDGSVFSNCNTPRGGPLMCGDVLVGIVDGDCKTSRRHGDQALGYIPVEKMFDFIVDYMESKDNETTTTTATTKLSASSGLPVEPHPDTLLILMIIVYSILRK